MQNYIKLDDFSLLNYKYVFIDSPDFLADQLFIQHEVRVHFGKHFKHPDLNYEFIFCHIRKKDEPRFLAALSELPAKMLLMGYKDYEEACMKYMKMLNLPE